MNGKENCLMVSKVQSSQTPSASILQSKKQIEMIQNEIQDLQHQKKYFSFGAKKWQITSGMSLDWKTFEEAEKMKSQLMLKDIQNNQNTIFSYIVQQWKNQQPLRVIYKWIRIPKTRKINKNAKNPLLLQQQHIYRGQMTNYHKNGEGLYIVLQKFVDNSQKMTKLSGFWKDDMLENGVVMDDTGKEQVLSRNMIKLNNRSFKKLLTQEVDKNLTIQDIKKNTSRICIPINTEKLESTVSLAITKH